MRRASIYARRLVWATLASGLLVLAIRTFVGDVYRVSSSSMEPVCREGEYLFVLHDRSAPERFDLVVARRGKEYLVKRAAGLGGKIGEDVCITGGDLRVNGRRLDPATTHRRGVPVFDDGLLALEEHFNHGEVWTRDERGVFVLDARDVPVGANAGLLRYHGKLTDGFLAPDGTAVSGLHHVGDLVLEAELVVPEPGGRLRASLIERGDVFTFAVDLSQEGTVGATLEREAMGQGLEVIEETLVPFETGRPIHLRFANVDNHLSVEWTLGDPRRLPPVAQATYVANTPDPRDPTGRGESVFERVTLGGEGCRLELHHLRILRDVHWTAHGEHAVGRELALQPGEVFLLGDNSAQSYDSRHFGPLPVDRIVGRPLWVVWPPGAFRRVR